MPLVRVFSNKGLKERHWKDISEIVRFNINPEKSETLNRIVKMELSKEDYDKLEEISDKASKEYGIEKILQKMKDVLILYLLSTFSNHALLTGLASSQCRAETLERNRDICNHRFLRR